MRHPETSAKLRDEIDHGRGADKVSFPDPAAAPLGTDDEAAGYPPTAQQVDTARQHEIRAEPEARPVLQYAGMTLGKMLLVAGGIVVALVIAFYLTR